MMPILANAIGNASMSYRLVATAYHAPTGKADEHDFTLAGDIAADDIIYHTDF